ncbi:MAG: hypothetical protein ACTHKL_13935 [Streptosporangiaceae bacterium]
MRSRILLGVSAWVLGAASATAGSLYAVDQLGEGLLAQHSKEMSVATVNAELALENTDKATPAIPTPAPATHSKLHLRHGTRGSRSGPPLGHVQRSASKLLTSPGGTAAASCDNGLAHLLYWSPAQGFVVEDVHQGPGRPVSVTFTNSSGGVVMRVACSVAGVPHAHVSPWSSGGGTHHDE